MMYQIEKWGKENIIWVGNKHTNKSSRRNYMPEIIVNHISEGSAQSCINWFTTPGNKDSSAHFLVARNGKVYQFVAIEDNAWANGLDSTEIKESKSIVVKNRGVNPNWYSVSIEHEGVYEQTKGELTDAQLQSTIMLHKYIIDYCERGFHYKIKADNEHILGHNKIDPVQRPNCPGEKFPFDEMIKALDYENQLEDALKTLVDEKILISPAYWQQNAVEGQPVKGEYAGILIKNFADYINRHKV